MALNVVVSLGKCSMCTCCCWSVREMSANLVVHILNILTDFFCLLVLAIMSKPTDNFFLFRILCLEPGK